MYFTEPRINYPYMLIVILRVLCQAVKSSLYGVPLALVFLHLSPDGFLLKPLQCQQ